MMDIFLKKEDSEILINEMQPLTARWRLPQTTTSAAFANHHYHFTPFSGNDSSLSIYSNLNIKMH